MTGLAGPLDLSDDCVQFGEQVGCFGRADPLEYLQRLPQQVPCLRGLGAGSAQPATSPPAAGSPVRAG
jgi:hypothetical protein